MNPGQITDPDHTRTRSYVSEEATDELPLGTMVARGSADDGALLLTSTADQLAGVVAYSDRFARLQVGDVGIMPGVSFRAVTRGPVLVEVEEAVRVGDPVHVRAAGDGDIGYFRASAVAGETINLSALARWVAGSSPGSYAELDIDLGNAGLAVADE